MPIRQKLSRLEAKPKKVLLSPTFRDPSGIARNDDFAKAVDHIRLCIANGTPLPSGYYSKGAGLRSDTMLVTFGIMHLHLGRWNTDELLWLVQYPEHVVFLELSDHKPFADRPVGERLHRFHAQGIVAREKEIDAWAAADLAAGTLPRLTYGEKRRLGLIKRPTKPK